MLYIPQSFIIGVDTSWLWKNKKNCNYYKEEHFVLILISKHFVYTTSLEQIVMICLILFLFPQNTGNCHEITYSCDSGSCVCR